MGKVELQSFLLVTSRKAKFLYPKVNDPNKELDFVSAISVLTFLFEKLSIEKSPGTKIFSAVALTNLKLSLA